MKINPLDIRRQQFAKKTFGGLDPDDVDGFMKQLAEQWEGALDDVRTANERASDMESKLKHYERVEMALQEALETARETGRRAEALAEQKAKMLIEEAELRARQILQDAERDRHGIRQDLVKLTSRQNEIGARLRGFLLSELEILAQYQGDDPVGFIKLQPANPDGSDYRIEARTARLGRHDRADEDEAFSEPLMASAYAPYAEARLSDAPDETDATEARSSEAYRTEARLGDATAAAPPVTETPEPAEAPSDPEPVEAALAEPMPDARPAEDVRPEAPSDAPAWAPDPPAEAPSWNLRSLVTGESDSVTGSEAERDRIRRILDDLD